MGPRTLTHNKIMFIFKALKREVEPNRRWSGSRSNTFLNRGLVAIVEKCVVPEYALRLEQASM